jgi:anti-sigma B factor antagonist
MPERHDPSMSVEDQGDQTVICFAPGKTLDEQASQVVGDRLDELVQKFGRHKLVLDFDNVVYLASGALARLIGLNKSLRERGGTLTLRNVDAKLYEIFEVTKVNQLFKVVRKDGVSKPVG